MLFTSRCKAFKHTGQLTGGDQVMWLWCERAAHRLYGQFFCRNKILYVGMLVFCDCVHMHISIPDIVVCLWWKHIQLSPSGFRKSRYSSWSTLIVPRILIHVYILSQLLTAGNHCAGATWRNRNTIICAAGTAIYCWSHMKSFVFH